MTKDLTFLCPKRRRIFLERTVLLRRKHGGQGKVLVPKGAKVLPETILVEGDVPSGFRPVRLAQSLGVSPQKAAQYLLKKPGDKVKRGEEIARKKSFLGFGAAQVFSPIDGQIKEYNEDSDILLLEFYSKHEQILSGAWGIVDAIEGSEVLIRTKMLEIYGVVGSGKVREGAIKILAGENDFLLASQIDDSSSGKILVGGGMVSSESLSKALVVGVSGIVTGGMHAKDFWAVGGGAILPFAHSSDVGMTTILMEGLGHIPFFDNAFKILAQNEGKIAFVDGDEAKVSIPLPGDPDPIAQEDDGSQGELEQIKVGDFVRTCGCSNIGMYGKVKSIGSQKMVFESGLEDFFVEVESQKGLIKVPPENLEILV